MADHRINVGRCLKKAWLIRPTFMEIVCTYSDEYNLENISICNACVDGIYSYT